MKRMNAMQSIKGLIAIIALVMLMPIAAFAQKGMDRRVNISLKQANVETVLKEVQKQTGLNFFYSADLAKTWPKVSINAQGKTAEQVIEQVTQTIKCVYEVNDNIVTIKTQQKASGKMRQITGFVKDENGQALVGVPVCIGETKVCTITDADGKFEFPIPVEKTTLKFTYVGMETTYVSIPAGQSAALQNITMNYDTNLDEVIVTGYQTISKKNMTGATITINSDQLQDRYTSNLLSNLEGRVAGLSTYGGELKVRGTSSLYAETTPLLVVDGLPMEGKLDDLNQYDIETINVLKDAAATAIYGARASNGVIVVTTKNAHKKGKIDIDFSANVTLTENRNMDYSDNFYMNAAEQVAAESRYWDYYYGEYGGTPTTQWSTINSGVNAASSLQKAYYDWASDNISKSELESIKTTLSGNNFAKEWADAMYRQQVMQEYNLSLRSRSDKSQNNVTLNYKYDNTGIKNHMNKQATINYKGSFDLTKWLTANVSINAVMNKNVGQGDDYSSYSTINARGGGSNVFRHPAYESFYNADGSYRKLYGWFDGNEYWDGLQPGLVDLGTAPVDELYNNVVTSRRQHMRYHGDLVFKIIDGLTLNTQLVYETDHTTREWYCNADSHVARVLHNAYATKNADGSISYGMLETGGLKQNQNTDGQYWTARAQANYSKTFGKHTIIALAGLEFRETKYKGSNGLLLGYDDQLQTSSTTNVNLGDLYNKSRSDYFFSQNGGYGAQQFAFRPYIENSMNVIKERLHRYGSGYANFTYTYDEKYNIFGSFRKDYADVYGLNSKFRGKPLWSVGAAWNIENEEFMKPFTWVNYAKLRVSYGKTGNIYQGATSYMTASTGTTNSHTKLPMATITSPANPNLTWETSTTINVGLDYSFLDNRIRGSLDYYHKKATDVFSNKTLDPTSGFSSMFVNSAEMVNNGIELLLTADWFRKKNESDFGWSTTFTLAHNKNEVTKVDNPATQAYQLTEGGSYPFVEGYPSSALWSYRFAGISDGTPENGYGAGAGETLWYGQENIISHSAIGGPEILEYSGQTDPKIILGMGNEFEWKGFNLGIQMSYYGGHVMRCLPKSETFGVGYGTVASYFLNAWTPDNKTDIPGYAEYGSTSLGSEPLYGNNAVYNASFLKIRNIVFGYSLPRKVLSKIGFNRVRLQFQIDNPKALWTANKVNVDPETLGVRRRANYIFSLNVNL